MTYFELLSKANRLLDKGEITIGQRDEMTKPLWDEIRPKGEWKKHGLCFECPECHCGCMFTIVDKIVYGELNFCPNCGAKMKGGDNNECI